MKYFLMFFFLLTINGGFLYGQKYFSAGVTAGGGIINSNSPDVGAFTSSIFIEARVSDSSTVSYRLSFLYLADFNSLLPETNYGYYPFVKGISLKGMLAQDLSSPWFLEEGFGLLLLNDRTYSDYDYINYGVVFSLSGGLYAGKIKIGAGTEYGLTFSNTYARYLSVHLFMNYTF